MTKDDRERVGLTAGTVVGGRYRIEDELGRGGFARVYRAAHVDLGRPAALKVIDLPQQAGAVDAFISRFLREARIAANLSHPNVVTVYDYGVVEQTGQPFLAMELLEGWDLEMALSHHGPITPPRAVDLMLEVLDALSVAQDKGIVHKDLKPSNLFFVGEGTPRERIVLIDFGIARLWDDDDSRITQTGGFTGTPAYFAPEYVQHQIVTPAIDVYQCGLILIEMMTALPAVDAPTSMAFLLKHCSGDIDIPPQLRNSVLGPILDKALAVDHTQRYADCRTFRAALAQIDSSQIPAPKRSTGGPAVRHSTLEQPPTTDEFSETMQSGETLAADVIPVQQPSQQAGPPEPPRRTPIGIVVGVVVVLLLLGGVAIMTSKEPPPVPKAPPALVVEKPPPVVVEAAPTPAATATISSVPSGARVKIDGIVMGEAPVQVGGEYLEGEHQVELVLPKHAPLVLTRAIQGGQELILTLQPIVEPPPPKVEKDKHRRTRSRKSKPVERKTPTKVEEKTSRKIPSISE